MEPLPSGALLILKILHGYRRSSERRGLTYVWPSQDELAKDARISLRQVRYHLRLLERLGFIATERRGRGFPNRYRFLKPEQDDRQPIAGLERQPIAGLERQPIAGLERQPIAGPINTDKQLLEATATTTVSASAAAAELRELLHNETLAQRLAARDPELALIAAQATKAALARGELLRSRAGFVVGIFKHPERYGIGRDASGTWTMGEPSQTKTRREEISKANTAELARKDAEQRTRLETESRRLTWWQSLPEETRARIETDVRHNQPLYARGPQIAFTWACVRRAEAQFTTEAQRAQR